MSMMMMVRRRPGLPVLRETKGTMSETEEHRPAMNAGRVLWRTVLMGMVPGGNLSMVAELVTAVLMRDWSCFPLSGVLSLVMKDLGSNLQGRKEGTQGRRAEEETQ